MAKCKRCPGEFEWALSDGRWVPLEPIATHDELPKSFVDNNGVLRADHRERCGGAPVYVTRLKRKIPGDPPEQIENAIERAVKEVMAAQ